MVAQGPNETALRSALVSGSKQVSALPFCPIADGNVIKLTAYLNELHVPEYGGVRLDNAVRYNILGKLSAAAKKAPDGRLKLGFTISKSSSMINKYHLYVAIGDSSLDRYSGL